MPSNYVLINIYYFLMSILCVIFNQSLAQCKIPPTWKTSCMVPVPKESPVRSMTDLRPVALTSAVMKIFERVVLIHFQVLVTDFLDPWQFAYRRNRSVENAVLRVFNSIYAHLDKPGTYIRLMFFDFSSAFSTIQPHL